LKEIFFEFIPFSTKASVSTDLYISYIHTHLTHVHASICVCISFSALANFYSCVTNVLILKI
jgi:hypothetical protein